MNIVEKVNAPWQKKCSASLLQFFTYSFSITLILSGKAGSRDMRRTGGEKKSFLVVKLGEKRDTEPRRELHLGKLWNGKICFVDPVRDNGSTSCFWLIPLSGNDISGERSTLLYRVAHAVPISLYDYFLTDPRYMQVLWVNQIRIMLIRVQFTLLTTCTPHISLRQRVHID